jgi:hypothetical protein
MNKFILVHLLVLFFSVVSGAAEVTLSTISFEVPAEAASGNKVIMSTDGMSTYAWNRLRLDSASYYYSYSFKLDNALFEFRECHRVDIYEGYETFYKPKFAQSKESKNFQIPRFLNTPNEFLNKSFSSAVVEYDQGMRKLLLFYTIDQTGLFMVSVKTKYPVETFLKAQETLDSILISAKRIVPEIPSKEAVVQKGEIAGRTKHLAIELPVYVSNDFNNPVVAAHPGGSFVVGFAHATGTEVFKINSAMSIEWHTHHDKIMHDIAISEKGFYSLSSTDYNMLSYGVYPSLYLNKHNWDGTVNESQVVFKKNDLKRPGNQVFDFYSRDNVCLEISDTFGIIYMNSEKRFKDFKILQSGVYKTFSLENGILKKGNQDPFHLSHCFAQASVADSKYAYLVSLSDGIPRGICLSKIDIAVELDSTDTTSFYHHVLYKIDGGAGDNYVSDTHISEPVLYNNYIYVIIETEQGARADIDNNELSTNRGHNDLFLVKCELNTKELVVKQLTKTDKIEEMNPKLCKLKDELLLIYTEAKFDKQTSRYNLTDKYILLDERGGKQSYLEEFDTYYQHEKREDYKMPDGPLNRDGSNLVTLTDGSVIWVRLLKNSREIEVVKFE